jgi:rubrerythrin
MEEDMGGMTVEQAIRNAVEVERSAARFYQLLSESTEDPEAKSFLSQMRDDEVRHAKSIEELGKRVTSKELPIYAEGGCESVETAPAWKYVDGIDYLSALRVALEAERSAALFYSAVAEAFTGDEKQFFEDLSETEEMHARRVQEMIDNL